MLLSKVINSAQYWIVLLLSVLGYLATVERVASVAVLSEPGKGDGIIGGLDDNFLTYFRRSFRSDLFSLTSDDPFLNLGRNRQEGHNSGPFQEPPVMDKPGLFFPDSLNPWTLWSPCVRGAQTRTRGPADMARLMKCGHLECLQTRQCESSSAPVLAQWGTWAQWSQCTSIQRGSSERTRVRQCQGQSTRSGGTVNSAHDHVLASLGCTGSAIERSACENRFTFSDGSQWTSWSSWSQCQSGNQIRTRSCTGSVRCTGAQRETQICYNNAVKQSWMQNDPCVSLMPFRYRNCGVTPSDNNRSRKQSRWTN